MSSNGTRRHAILILDQIPRERNVFQGMLVDARRTYQQMQLKVYGLAFGLIIMVLTISCSLMGAVAGGSISAAEPPRTIPTATPLAETARGSWIITGSATYLPLMERP